MNSLQLEVASAISPENTAAVWPGTEKITLRQAADNDEFCSGQISAPAVRDVPAGVGRIMVGTYGLLMVTFLVTMGGDSEALFAIMVGTLYVCMFFAVPRLFFHVEPAAGTRPALARFMSQGMDTSAGHISGPGALAHILIVPATLTLAILAMGIIGAALL